MNHDEARLACSRRLDGPIEPGNSLELDAHLSGCSECRAFAAGLDKTVAALGKAAAAWAAPAAPAGPGAAAAPAAPAPAAQGLPSAGYVEMPEALHSRIMDTIAATPQVRPASFPWLAALILVAAAAALAVFIQRQRRPPPTEAPNRGQAPSQQAPAGQAVPSAPGEPVKEPAPFLSVEGKPSPTEAKPLPDEDRRKPAAIPPDFARNLRRLELLIRMQPAAPMSLVLKGPLQQPSGGPAIRDEFLAKLEQAGLKDWLRDPALIELAARRAARAERIRTLLADGAVTQDQYGMLVIAQGRSLAPDDLKEVQDENADRKALLDALLQRILPRPAPAKQPAAGQLERRVQENLQRLFGGNLEKPSVWELERQGKQRR